MGTRKNIVVIDDEPDAIEFVKAVLSSIGEFNIIPAKMEKKALSSLKSTYPT